MPDNKSTKSVPEWMEIFFWDTDIDQLDVDKNSAYIITRLLNLGNQHTLRWLFDTYSQDEILYVVKHSRNLLLKSAMFWKYYFNLQESEMKCFEIFDFMKGIYSF